MRSIVAKAFGAKKSDIATEFKQAFARKKPQDVLYFAAGSRPSVKNLLNRKLEKTKVPVSNYLFAWKYPRSVAARLATPSFDRGTGAPNRLA
jgi:hypothetical protein